MHKMTYLCIRRFTVRTTLDIPENLVNEAMKRAGINTKTGVIVAALEGLIRRSKISGLKKYKGKVDIDINLDVVRGRSCR
jgi:Arc/MetJ family transcription regulator